MEKKVYGIVSIFMVLLTVAVTVFFVTVPDFHQYALSISGESASRASVMDTVQAEEDISEGNESRSAQIHMDVPEGISMSNVTLTKNDINREIVVQITGLENSYFQQNPIAGSVDHIQDVYYDYAGGVGTIEFIMDSIYETEVVLENRQLSINFIDPRDLYDYIVVVDPGHGGNDHGCEWEGLLEKDLTQQIVLKMKDIFDASGREDVMVYYTRLDDEKLYLKQRSGMANNLRADLFLSVHINSTATGRESYINGTSVMYQVADETGKSKEFAQTVLNSLLDSLGSLSKGIVAGDENYIIRTAEMPVALAEIGFITNPEERELLASDEYQEQTAQALCDAVFEALSTVESRRGETYHDFVD